MKQIKWMVLLLNVLGSALVFGMERPHMTEAFVRKLASDAFVGQSRDSLDELQSALNVNPELVHPVLEQRILKNTDDANAEDVLAYIYYLNMYIGKPETNLNTIKSILRNCLNDNLRYKSMVLDGIQTDKFFTELFDILSDTSVEELQEWHTIFANTRHAESILTIIRDRQGISTEDVLELQAEQEGPPYLYIPSSIQPDRQAQLQARKDNASYWMTLERQMRNAVKKNDIHTLLDLFSDNFSSDSINVMPSDAYNEIMSIIRPIFETSVDERVQHVWQNFQRDSIDRARNDLQELQEATQERRAPDYTKEHKIVPATQFPLTPEQEESIQQIGKEIEQLIEKAPAPSSSAPKRRIEVLVPSMNIDGQPQEGAAAALFDIAHDAGYESINHMLASDEGKALLHAMGYDTTRLCEQYKPKILGKGKTRKRALSAVEPVEEQNMLPQDEKASAVLPVNAIPSPSAKKISISSAEASIPVDAGNVQTLGTLGGFIMFAQNRPVLTIVGICAVAYIGSWLYNKYWVDNKDEKIEEKKNDIASEVTIEEKNQQPVEQKKISKNLRTTKHKKRR
ncbi:MAG TPA: hypothetical protein PLU71_03185 [Candidatus Dependentiae bacterium]|nr:hypothetical protein [Candidatus Dependentiae bacterium]HRQ62835.1 hypothetical protein [Candidatus Dependentiae bacterium]